MSPVNHYITRAEWQRTSCLLTFRIDYFFRTILLLTMSPSNLTSTAAHYLRLMVVELKDQSIVGLKRLKSWMLWHREMAWFVALCLPHPGICSARAEWAGIMRPESEF